MMGFYCLNHLLEIEKEDLPLMKPSSDKMKTISLIHPLIKKNKSLKEEKWIKKTDFIHKY